MDFRGAVKALTGGVWDGPNRCYSDSNPPETLMLTETSTVPATPAAGFAVLYTDTAGRSYIRADDGISREITNIGTTGPPVGLTFGHVRSGSYYYLPVDGGNNVLAVTLNRLYAAPFTVPRDVTLDQLGVEVTTAGAAGSVVRLGLYGSTTDGLPGTLIADYGTLTSTTVGAKTITTPATKPALSQRTIYYLGVVGQGAAPTLRTRTGNNDLVGDMSATPAAAVFNVYRYATDTLSGALPATFGTPIATPLVGPAFHLRFTG